MMIYQDAASLCALARSFIHEGRFKEAYRILSKHRGKFPDDPTLAGLLNLALENVVPGWHFAMLNDTARNQFYEQAINRAVQPGDIVLDIGTGSGLLAMMAVRAGAAHVYACEANDIMAELAIRIIEQNGYADKITVIPFHSSKLEVGKHMPERADVLITETFSELIVGEGVLNAVMHARRNLLKPGAEIVPETAELLALPYEAARVDDQLLLESATDISGFDLSQLQKLSINGTSMFPLRARIDDPVIYSGRDLSEEEITLVSFDLDRGQTLSPQTLSDVLHRHLSFHTSGQFNALKIHMRLCSHGHEYDVARVSETTHWREMLLPLGESHQVSAGDTLPLTLWYTMFPAATFYAKAGN